MASIPDELIEQFLDKLKNYPNITQACRETGLLRSTIYERMKARPDFAARVEEAKKMGWGILEEEALRRAVDGVDKGVYHDGEKVATERIYSDGLLSKLLIAHCPEKYKERTETEVKGSLEIVVKNYKFEEEDK